MSGVGTGDLDRLHIRLCLCIDSIPVDGFNCFSGKNLRLHFLSVTFGKGGAVIAWKTSVQCSLNSLSQKALYCESRKQSEQTELSAHEQVVRKGHAVGF